MQFSAYYFSTSSGKNPIKEFIFQQDVDTQNKILEMIDDFKDFGFRLPAPDLKKMAGEKDLWELRIKNKGNIYRVFVGKLKKGIGVILHIIQKKSQKTPRKDLKTAIKRLQICKQYGGL